MRDILNNLEENKYEEEWKVIIGMTKAEYVLSKLQAMILQQAIARKEKAVIFETFIISIPFIAEFYRTKRFLKGTKQLSARTTEPEYIPIPVEKWEELKKKIYAKINNVSNKQGGDV